MGQGKAAKNWQGGGGSRNQATMDKKDKHKYKGGAGKTVAKKGETKKKRGAAAETKKGK